MVVVGGVGVARENISRGPEHWMPTRSSVQCRFKCKSVHSSKVPSDPEQVKAAMQVEGEERPGRR